MSEFKLSAESFTHPIFKDVPYRNKSICEAPETARARVADKYNECQMFPLLLKYYEATKAPAASSDKSAYIDCPLMRWGKYKGTPIKDLDPGYVNWIINGENTIYDSTKEFIKEHYYKHNPTPDKKDTQ